ncbi:MAG: tRNA threonylcarbamoyladenosine dehydratase [Bacteroidota bacterium]
MHWLERTELLLGKEKMEKLQQASVLVAGLGGVGAYAAEMLCRAGIGKLTLADHDTVSVSNRNRQLIALQSTEGMSKVKLMADRLKDINPDLQLTVLDEFLRDTRTVELLEHQTFDYVVDAIDTLSPKVFLIYHAVSRGIKVVSSMGSGGKLDPSRIEVTDLSKSYHCRLAFNIRKSLRKLGIENGVTVVFSPEPVPRTAVTKTHGEQNKKSNVGTISYMPPIFGCTCASEVVKRIIA